MCVMCYKIAESYAGSYNSASCFDDQWIRILSYPNFEFHFQVVSIAITRRLTVTYTSRFSLILSPTLDASYSFGYFCDIIWNLQVYYMVDVNNNGNLLNFSGCGNSLSLSHTQRASLIFRSLLSLQTYLRTSIISCM